MKLSVFWSNNTLPLNGLRGGFKMDDEKKVFSFSSEELREAEELNARADTRMTEEYKQFLEEHFGGEGELYHEHIDESNEYVDRSAGRVFRGRAYQILRRRICEQPL